MTYPCINTNHFEVTADGLRPRAHMQFRRVATTTVGGVEATLPATGGGNKDIVLQSASVSWINDSPVQQWVYGLVTRGGCRITLTAKSRGYLKMFHSGQVGTPGTLVPVSKVGVGAQAGKAGLFAGDTYCIAELRQNAVTMPLNPSTAGFTPLNPTQAYYAWVEVRFVSDYWQSSSIDGGNTQTESGYETGETRIDLFAIPAI